ncbi:MAG: FHA domain-containing protein [Anaerolineales bacterium]|nr:FHA domain-containing protein [Anaerolineales bacterium]
MTQTPQLTLQRLMRKLGAFLFICSLVLSAATSAYAQNQTLASATLYIADYSTFPKSSALLDVFDANGVFVSGLTPQALTIFEDGQSLPVDSLSEIAIPLQITVAVNQGAQLDTRDATSISRFQRASQVITQWAQTLPADLPDDFSLVSQAGAVINHASAAEFATGLSSFQPDFRSATPNLQALSIAIDTVSAQTPRLGMKRAILFITPNMSDGNLAATLDPLLQRALENKIHIFVWLVDLDTTFTSTSAAVFNALAQQTGGSLFTYSGVERFPDLEAYFSPLRRVYTATYTSRIMTAGAHQVGFQADTAAGELKSNEQQVNLDIQPPNPIPVTSSLQIVRQPPEDDPYNIEILLPKEQQIEIILEFPDGHPRKITRTTLYIDGQIVDENTAEPFDQFTWDLTAITASGAHQLTVEAVDELGLSKSSMATPVTVTVVKPPSGPLALLARYRNALTVGAILLAGLALILILSSGRLRLPSLRAAQSARRASTDPLTQPISATQAHQVETLKVRGKLKKAGSGERSKPEAAGALMRITAEGQPIAVTPITIFEKEMVFGADPVQCTQILDDRSIASVHARLRQTEDGGFLLLDGGSIAGTWVNYELVPREGRRLRAGDMVHFGRLIYRFTLPTTPEVKRPTITVLPPEE